mmetsp:Transcript_13334/g.49524  ORF Transcript_13334/g.49524 Transcript_13334/m.49524 type:complete len:264 (-) Transcript_13334:1057-1848(-)
MPKLRYGVNEVFAPGEADVPEAIDWTTKGAVTPVKDQGQCGSCWAFSTTGSVEGAHAIATGELVSLSEQQLVDCDTFVNNGCNGGSMDFALMWVSRNGLCTEDSYAYTAKDGKCHPCKTAADIKKKYDVEQNNEEALLAAVAKQPVSIAIEADQRAFQLYAGGVFTAECGTKLNHGVLAVGYGEDEDGTKFWKVKNSWGKKVSDACSIPPRYARSSRDANRFAFLDVTGEDWGEKGYIRMARDGRNNGAGQCGLAAQPVFPTA